MKPIAPNAQISVMQVLQSMYRTFAGNIGFGSVATYDGIGVPLNYTTDNTNGNMIRVGNATSTIPQKWTTPTSDTIINHSLGRIPVGYIVFRKSGPIDVYTGTVPWTETTICLQATVNTVDTHIYIF